MGRAGERSRFVSEEFALEQVGRNRGTVYLEECSMGAR